MNQRNRIRRIIPPERRNPPSHIARVAFALGILSAAITACGSDGAETAASGTAGAGGSGAGTPSFCEPGEKQHCYTAELVTEGVGTCKGGERTCNAQGTAFGVCEGQVNPTVDDCATPEDEDCDGAPAPACAGAITFGKRIGGTGEDIAQSVTVDSSGAVLATGSFEGSVDFGGGPLESGGGKDLFVVKLGPSGDHAWSKRFGDAGNQAGLGIAADKDGNAVVTGWFEGTVDFGGGPLVSGGGKDIFVLKLSPTGETLWSRAFGGLGATEQGVAAAVDASGDVLVTGVFDGTFLVGGSSLTSAGALDIFAMKIAAATGNPVWSQRFGDASDQIVRGVAVDGAGAAILAGGFKGAVDFGGGMLSSEGGEDAFLVKLDAGSGAHVYSARFGSGLDEAAQAVAADGTNVVVTGGFAGSIDLGGGPLQSAGAEDIFLAKLDEAGKHVWSLRFGDKGSQIPHAVSVNAAGAIALAGRFNGSLELGSKPPLPGTDAYDIFVAKLDPQGAHVWSRAFGGTFDQIALGAALDAGGNVAIGGFYLGSLTLGGEPLPSSGLRDLFLAKFAP